MSKSKQTRSLHEFREDVERRLKGMSPQTPIVATVTFQVDPAQESKFIERAEVLAEKTWEQTGVKQIVRQKRIGVAEGARAVEYLIREKWESVELFCEQWRSEHLKHFQHTVGEVLVAPDSRTSLPSMDLRFYEGVVEDGDDGDDDDETPSRVVVQPLATGQRDCWDSYYETIPHPCGTGQDGDEKLRKGLDWTDRRFEDNRDGTVTDTLTDLVWLKDADAFGEVTWDQALEKAGQLCEGSREVRLKDRSRHGQWRLPNLRELLSLIDYGEGCPILPNKGRDFENVKPAIYWTSTSLQAQPLMAWMMTLGIGPTVFDLKKRDNKSRMWPVRGESKRILRTGQTDCWDPSTGKPIPRPRDTGQDGELKKGIGWTKHRFKDNRDGTVTDTLTDLVWLKDANAFGFKAWEEALDVCNRLHHGHANLSDRSEPGDWRLPNIREIESLVDYGRVGPCLPDGYEKVFENVRPSSYWTSTSVTLAPSEAMFIILGVGPSIFESKEHPFFVWPVRDPFSRR